MSLIEVKNIEEKLKTFFKNEICLVHSLNVKDKARELALHYKVDPYKAEIAGLLHDCARELQDIEIVNKIKEHNILPPNIYFFYPNNLLHSEVSAIIAKEEFGITDNEILSAIKKHTLGDESMTLLDKIIFIADKIEPSRDYKEIDQIRNLAFKNIDKAMLLLLNKTIYHLLANNMLIAEQTIKSRNKLLLTLQE